MIFLLIIIILIKYKTKIKKDEMYDKKEMEKSDIMDTKNIRNKGKYYY